MIFSKRKTLGVLINRRSLGPDKALLAVLEQETRRLDYDAMIFLSPLTGDETGSGAVSAWEKYRKYISPEKLDGFLIVSGPSGSGWFRDVSRELSAEFGSCPCVMLREETDGTPCVYSDQTLAMRTMVRHLIEEHKLTDIRLYAGEWEDPETGARLEGYEQEMAAHGLAVPAEAVLRNSSVRAAVEACFSDPGHFPQAVACCSDELAADLIRELSQKNIRVPEDVIVTGFDYEADWCADIPSLTSVQGDDRGVAREAVEMLDRLIRGEKPDREKTRLPGTLNRGESCGCGRRPADYRRQMADRLRRLQEMENHQDAVMSGISRDVGACVSLEELHGAIIHKNLLHPTVRDHYICLFGTPGKLMDATNSETCLVHAFQDHADKGMPMISFPRDSLLPPMAEREGEAQFFYAALLEQENHDFGYSVLRYDQDQQPSGRFLQMNALLSIGLANIHNQNALMRLYEEQRISSLTDPMTGLLNRKGLMEAVEPQWPTLIGREIAFICIDMDYLKHTNDTFGHAAGDASICLIGRAIRESLADGAVGARIGGDEFIVFLPDAGGRSRGRAGAQIPPEAGRADAGGQAVLSRLGQRRLQNGQAGSGHHH